MLALRIVFHTFVYLLLLYVVQGIIPRESCTATCDFEDGTACGFTSLTNPFTIEKWTSGSVPQPPRGVYYAVNRAVNSWSDLQIPVSCSNGAISFRYYVSLFSAEKYSLEVKDSHDKMLFEYNEGATDGWQEAMAYFQDYQIYFGSYLYQSGDVAAFDDICIICLPSIEPTTGTSPYTTSQSTDITPSSPTVVPPSCAVSCNFEADNTCGWESSTNSFVVQKWTLQSVPPQPTNGVYYLVNDQTTLGYSLDVSLSCTSGQLSFSYFTVLSSPSEFAFFILDPEGTVMWANQGTSTSGWTKANIDFDYPDAASTKTVFFSSLDHSGDLVAIDDVCVICTGSSTITPTGGTTSKGPTSKTTSKHPTEVTNSNPTPPPSGCCDFEADTTCGWESSQPFYIEKWPTDAMIPQPAKGTNYLVNNRTHTWSMLDLTASGIGCSVTFDYYVNLYTTSDFALVLRERNTQTILFQYEGSTSTQWASKSVQLTDTQVYFESVLSHSGDVAALDNVCVKCTGT